MNVYIPKHYVESFTNWTMVVFVTSKEWAGWIVEGYTEYIAAAAGACILLATALAVYHCLWGHTG